MSRVKRSLLSQIYSRQILKLKHPFFQLYNRKKVQRKHEHMMRYFPNKNLKQNIFFRIIRKLFGLLLDKMYGTCVFKVLHFVNIRIKPLFKYMLYR